jgi:hypothetical protein
MNLSCFSLATDLPEMAPTESFGVLVKTSEPSSLVPLQPQAFETFQISAAPDLFGPSRFDPDICGRSKAPGAAAPFGVELTPIDVQDPSEIERAITAFAREPNSGLIVTGSTGAVVRRNRIIALALKYRLPNVYGFRYYPASGGLASYGPDPIDVHKRGCLR